MGFLMGVALFALARERSFSSHGLTISSSSCRSSENDGAILSYSCRSSMSRGDAAEMIDTTLLPRASFGDRLRVSGSSGSNNNVEAKSCNDPMLELAYGEFPFGSVDVLLDAALAHHAIGEATTANTDTVTVQSVNFVDVGSGAGRICLYMTMTRPGWAIYGVEIVPSLHAVAKQAATKAVDSCILTPFSLVINNEYTTTTSPSSLQLVRGPASGYAHVLKTVDILFCYSTVFDSAGFSPETGAMLLSAEWMTLFQHCKLGALVITTDRACDPAYGWTLLESIEVENREVMGSVGYVQRKDR